MSDEDPPDLPPLVPDPPVLTEDLVRPMARSIISIVATQLQLSYEQILQSKTQAESWTDEFWDLSGYDKTDTLAAFDALFSLWDVFNGNATVDTPFDYASQVAVLMTQAPPIGP